MKKYSAKKLCQVKQIIECNCVDAVNELLQSGDWILLNSYHKRIYGKNIVYCLGRIADYENQSNIAIEGDN